MSFSATPRPPGASASTLTLSQDFIGDPNQSYNPWFLILNTHLASLCYAAQRYGHKRAGCVPGCFMDEGRQYEIIPGISEVDGWVTRGDEPGQWDRLGLGWEDAWKNDD
ncbi:hypothetical protein BDN67DRAFT_1015453 [Paxillus ammoniavirescens]|nr:hypothetical protein BDN67DRAFT_1015453 [Paxillus ammoniavirescens]